MTGPFYVRDKDFQDQSVYKLAKCCEECAFCDKDYDFCPLNPCTYFYAVDFENNEDTKEN